MKEQYRHGDVFLERIECLPSIQETEYIKEKDNILLEGEVTGHAHRVDKGGDIYIINGTKYLVVENSAFITHEEHNTIEIPKGYYKMTRQREFNPYDKANIKSKSRYVRD